MSRPLIAVFPFLVLALAGCDAGRAEAESLKAHDELRHTQGELERQKEENARLRAELEETRKQLDRNADPDNCLEQTGDFSAVTGTSTFVISYRRAYARVPELTFPKSELDPARELVVYEVTERRTDGFTIKVEQHGPRGEGWTATSKKIKWTAKGVPAPRK